MSGLDSIALAVARLEKEEPTVAADSSAPPQCSGSSSRLLPVPKSLSETQTRVVSVDNIVDASSTTATTASSSVADPPESSTTTNTSKMTKKKNVVSPDPSPSKTSGADNNNKGGVNLASILSNPSAWMYSTEKYGPIAPPPPSEKIAGPDVSDVLCGRGGETNHHQGNIQYRNLVKAFQPLYIASKRRDKPRIAQCIVYTVRRMGGRFLKRVGGSGDSWTDVGNTKAREKTSQALREGAPELRNGNGNGSPSNGTANTTSSGNNNRNGSPVAGGRANRTSPSSSPVIHNVADRKSPSSIPVSGLHHQQHRSSMVVIPTTTPPPNSIRVPSAVAAAPPAFVTLGGGHHAPFPASSHPHPHHHHLTPLQQAMSRNLLMHHHHAAAAAAAHHGLHHPLVTGGAASAAASHPSYHRAAALMAAATTASPPTASSGAAAAAATVPSPRPNTTWLQTVAAVNMNGKRPLSQTITPNTTSDEDAESDASSSSSTNIGGSGASGSSRKGGPRLKRLKQRLNAEEQDCA